MSSLGPLLVALVLQGGIAPEFAALFEVREHRYTGGDYHDEVFRYRLFVPDTANAQDRRALLVWLHGHGEAGRDNLLQLTWLSHLVMPPPWRRERYGFYLLAVQCPLDNPDWVCSSSSTGDDMIHVLLPILDETLRRERIDLDRIYLSGVSGGGSGCWELACQHTDRFAAVAPLAAGFPEEAIQLRDLSIWAFHSKNDQAPPIEPVRQGIEAIKSAGGRAHLTEIDSANHDCWTVAFQQYYLMDWLLTQRRGSLAHPPGTIPLQVRLSHLISGWHSGLIFLQAAILVTLAYVVWLYLKRLRRISR